MYIQREIVLSNIYIYIYIYISLVVYIAPIKYRLHYSMVLTIMFICYINY